MDIPTKILLAKAQWNQCMWVWCRHLLSKSLEESFFSHENCSRWWLFAYVTMCSHEGAVAIRACFQEMFLKMRSLARMATMMLLPFPSRKAACRWPIVV